MCTVRVARAVLGRIAVYESNHIRSVFKVVRAMPITKRGVVTTLANVCPVMTKISSFLHTWSQLMSKSANTDKWEVVSIMEVLSLSSADFFKPCFQQTACLFRLVQRACNGTSSKFSAQFSPNKNSTRAIPNLLNRPEEEDSCSLLKGLKKSVQHRYG